LNVPFLVPVGGFLGAGKTSLILAASRVLQERGFRAAAIFNDQGGELVDTAHVLRQGIFTGEVAGACFCCRFSELLSVADQLRALDPHVIFIEPVGSCTDLAATVMRPLLSDRRSRYRLAPLTVLVDPTRLAELRSPGADPSLTFLFETQIAEADLVVFSKFDLLKERPALPGSVVRFLSAKTGQGVRAWLDEALSGALTVGGAAMEIDYAAYARAEAALGWLNWSGTVELEQAISPAELIGPWMDGLQGALGRRGATVAHLKVLDQAGGAYLKTAVTGNGADPVIEGDLMASPETVHVVRFNVRAVIGADDLRNVFERELERVPGGKVVHAFQCFSPAAPRPERRYPAPLFRAAPESV
jgi:CobW/HypB/UreG, nucleotide-binding domain